MTLKLATSLDGRIATASGESRWITGEEARAAVHRLRAEHDAVVVGIGTALADDPELTVRSPGYAGPQPARVVLDSHGRLPPHSKLAKTAGRAPTYVVRLPLSATSSSPVEAGDDQAGSGLQVLEVSAGADGRPDTIRTVQELRARGLAHLFVEGGGQVAASFLQAGLIDRIEWFRAPIVLGAEGRPCVGVLDFGRLCDARRFRRVSVKPLGEDLWERYERR